jgi:hypothetical protein
MDTYYNRINASSTKPVLFELVPKPGWFRNKLLENRSKARFSHKFKEAVPKAEVLEQPHLIFPKTSIFGKASLNPFR